MIPLFKNTKSLIKQTYLKSICFVVGHDFFSTKKGISFGFTLDDGTSMYKMYSACKRCGLVGRYVVRPPSLTDDEKLIKSIID